MNVAVVLLGLFACSMPKHQQSSANDEMAHENAVLTKESESKPIGSAKLVTKATEPAQTFGAPAEDGPHLHVLATHHYEGGSLPRKEMRSVLGGPSISACFRAAANGLVVLQGSVESKARRIEVLGVDGQTKTCLLKSLAAVVVPSLPDGDAVSLAFFWQPTGGQAQLGDAVLHSSLNPVVHSELSTCFAHTRIPLAAEVVTYRLKDGVAVWPSSLLQAESCVVATLEKHYTSLAEGLTTNLLWFEPSATTTAVLEVEKAKRRSEAPVYGGLSGDDFGMPPIVPRARTLLTHHISTHASPFENARYEYIAGKQIQREMSALVDCLSARRMTISGSITTAIGANGSVSEVWVNMGEGSEATGNCIEAALRRFTFSSPPSGGARISLRFSSADA